MASVNENFKEVVVIGIGGIGGCLLPILCKYLEFLNANGSENYRVCLVDGDQYEERNRYRQFFTSMGNKARATVNRFRDISPNLEMFSVPEYVDEKNVRTVIREGAIVFLCVDNHGTRKIISDRCEDLSDIVLISGGNELKDGNIQLHIKRNGVDFNGTLPLTNFRHPEIANPAEDDGPAEPGCELAVRTDPQIIIMNNAIAATMLNVFYAYLENAIDFMEIYVDILTCETRKVMTFHSGAAANMSDSNYVGLPQLNEVNVA